LTGARAARRGRRAVLAGLLCLASAFPMSGAAVACETALVLAIDISGSIDAGEYALQIQGLAAALDDAAVREELLRGQVALAVVQWSGVGRQALVLPWRRMLSEPEIDRFAAAVRALPRAFTASDTAVGEAITFSASQFAAVPDCRRKVIDISGDGPENAGYTVARARSLAQRAGIEINAIAIEDIGASTPITAFYLRWVITRGGFVVTARGLGDYPRAIRVKLLRELSRVIG
jgi:Ca-activated chloride channel family protein